MSRLQESFSDTPGSWTVAVTQPRRQAATVKLYAVCIKK